MITMVLVNFKVSYAMRNLLESLNGDILVEKMNKLNDIDKRINMYDDIELDPILRTRGLRSLLLNPKAMMKHFFYNILNRKKVSIYYTKVPMNNGRVLFIPKDLASNHYFPG